MTATATPLGGCIPSSTNPISIGNLDLTTMADGSLRLHIDVISSAAVPANSPGSHFIDTTLTLTIVSPAGALFVPHNQDNGSVWDPATGGTQVTISFPGDRNLRSGELNGMTVTVGVSGLGSGVPFRFTAVATAQRVIQTPSTCVLEIAITDGESLRGYLG